MRVRPKIYSKEGDEVAEPIDDVGQCTASHNVASSVGSNSKAPDCYMGDLKPV
jgi:hypothetical protein